MPLSESQVKVVNGSRSASAEAVTSQQNVQKKETATEQPSHDALPKTVDRSNQAAIGSTILALGICALQLALPMSGISTSFVGAVLMWTAFAACLVIPTWLFNRNGLRFRKSVRTAISIVIPIVTFLLVRSPLAAMRNQQPGERPTLSSKDLKNQTLFLVEEIRGLVFKHQQAQFRIAAAERKKRGESPDPTKETTIQKSYNDWAYRVELGKQADDEETGEYQRRLKARAIQFRDECRRRLPWYVPTIPGVDEGYLHPISDFSYTDVATDLEMMAKQLPTD